MFQLTIENIDQEWVWSQLVGRMITVGKSHRYCSPLRGDNSPGVWFEYHNGILLIIDFADKANSHINCITAWSRIKGVHWRVALREIFEKQTVMVNRKVKEKVKEVEKIITIREEWTKEHEKYWSKRGSYENLKGVSTYTIHGEKTRTYIIDELCFAYKHVEGKYKLYFPNRGKHEQRFVSNLKSQDVWFKYVNETLLISKCHKEFIELLPFWEHSLTHVQCENCWHDMVDTWKVFEKKLVSMDNDKTGIKNGLELAKKIDGLFFCIPTVDSLHTLNRLIDEEKYLTNNLKTILNEFQCNDCPDSIRVADYPIQELLGLKDLDDLKISNLDFQKIFNWLIE